MQFPLFKPEVTWAPPDNLPVLDNLVALDFETKDPFLKKLGPGWCFPHGGRIAGAGLATAQGSWYLPTGHEGGGNLDEGTVIRWLKAMAADPARTWVFCHALYDMGWARRYGIEFAGPVVDIQFLASLINEDEDSYSLDNMGERELGKRKDTKKLKEALASYGLKGLGDLYKLPAACAGEYGEGDASLTLDLYHHYMPIIAANRLERVNRLEHSQIPLLLDMRADGVRVNVNKAEALSGELKLKKAEALEEVKRLTGIQVNPWVAQSVAAALIESGAVAEADIPRTPKTAQPSIGADWLEGLDHEVPRLILESRKVDKMESMFVRNYILNHAVNGRVHCSFHPLKGEVGGAETGRYSSSNFNFQNLPNPENDPIWAFRLRSLIEPDEGDEWAAVDYSSQEPRLIIHWAVKMRAPGGAAMAQRFRDDPSTDLHQITADLCGIPRKPAKIINLGLVYGMGGAELCRQLGLATQWKEVTFRDTNETKEIEIAGEEGQRILNQHAKELPFVKSMADTMKNEAKRSGFVTTLSGRRGHFPKNAAGQYWYIHKALNKRIQGSAADQLKQAMAALWKEKIKIRVTVHDEVGLSITDRSEAKRAAEIMEHCLPLEVPFPVDVDIGTSWGEAKPVTL